ncbi:hypothetical protein [Mycolicibacterium fortuitum]|uniref:hypothetical protein n=1 Tax=Mycolicibacterium fortuitum TaxID=1766 RepID=UPI0026389ABB|nr:hypothetical protein [Mycolicibacterium fortuitum]
MKDLYALEQTGSEVAMGVDMPGHGMLTLTLRRDSGCRAVLDLDPSAFDGDVVVQVGQSAVWASDLSHLGWGKTA